MTRQQGYAPFTYRGLVEFLIMAEVVLDSLGEDQDTHQEAAHQLIYDVFVEPTGHVNLPTALVEHNIF